MRRSHEIRKVRRQWTQEDVVARESHRVSIAQSEWLPSFRGSRHLWYGQCSHGIIHTQSSRWIAGSRSSSRGLGRPRPDCRKVAGSDCHDRTGDVKPSGAVPDFLWFVRRGDDGSWDGGHHGIGASLQRLDVAP
jgi:hypothetical protein